MKTWIKTFAALLLLGAAAVRGAVSKFGGGHHYHHHHHSEETEKEKQLNADAKFLEDNLEKIKQFPDPIELKKIEKRYGGIIKDSLYTGSDYGNDFSNSSLSLELKYPIILTYQLQGSNIYGLSKKRTSLEYQVESDRSIALKAKKDYMHPANKDWKRDDGNYDMGFMPFLWDNGSTIEPTKIEIPEANRVRIPQIDSSISIDGLREKVKSNRSNTDMFEIPDRNNANFVYVFRLNYVYDDQRTVVTSCFGSERKFYYMKAMVVRRVKKPTTTLGKMAYAMRYPAGTEFAGSEAEGSIKSLIAKIIRGGGVKPTQNDKDIK